MKTFNFTEQEALELASFYKHKLSQTKNSLDNIEGILYKLEKVLGKSLLLSEAGLDDDEEGEFSDGKNLHEGNTEGEDMDFEISRFNWSEFILQALTRNDSVFTMAEIVDMGIKCYNLNKDERGKISKKVTPFFTQLLKSEEIRKFNIEGQSGYYYGITEWFLKNGRVKKPYLLRFTEDKKKNKREGRFHDNELQNFVASTLFEERRLMTFTELVAFSTIEFGYPESDKATFIFNLRDELDRMVTSRNLIKFDVPNATEQNYALPNWFKTNNEIRKPFITW